jgi:hypothetical protein
VKSSGMTFIQSLVNVKAVDSKNCLRGCGQTCTWMVSWLRNTSSLRGSPGITHQSYLLHYQLISFRESSESTVSYCWARVSTMWSKSLCAVLCGRQALQEEKGTFFAVTSRLLVSRICLILLIQPFTEKTRLFIPKFIIYSRKRRTGL